MAEYKRRFAKTLKSSFTTRMIFVILSLLVMIIMLTAILIYGSVQIQVLDRQILTGAETSLSVAQNMLDISLEKNADMMMILLSDQANSYYPDEISGEKEITYQFTQLYNHCMKYTSQLSPCDGTFILDRLHDRWGITGSAVSLEYQQKLRTFIEERTLKGKLFWGTTVIEDKVCLVYIQENSGINIGFWVEMQTMEQMLYNKLTEQPGNMRFVVEPYPEVEESAAAADVILSEAESREKEPDYLEVFAESRIQAFRLHSYIPRTDVFQNVSMLKRMLVTVCMIFLILIFIQYVIMEKLFLKPLETLRNAMLKIKGGSLSVRVPVETVNCDFKDAYETLNGMCDELTRLKIDIYEERISKQKYELEFLRLQIKPHFFLNCLNIIYSLVNAGRYSLIQTMVVRLSDYFRYIFRTTDSFVNVEKELEHVENYLRIQEVRYPDRFVYRIRRDADTDHIIIPPMMIQTFVENSIKYGFMNASKDRLKIGIRVQEEAEFYMITVRDNGKGFPEEQLAKLRKGISLEDQEGNHIGIHNTLKRLELLYHQKVRVDFQNEEGAQVHIFLPKLQRPSIP